MSAFDPRTDGQLLVATARDPEAFAVFYRRHVRGVLAFFRRRLDSPAIAFELTAETFAAALEASPRYLPRPEPARGWLYGIAWSELRAAQRSGRADDTARRALNMAPIALDDHGIGRIEMAAGAATIFDGPPTMRVRREQLPIPRQRPGQLPARQEELEGLPAGQPLEAIGDG
jgi:DNA-directed RNA polymerase specialized sigma24 family protein